MTNATKKSMLTAAITVSVLAVSGTAAPTGQAPIASTPIKQVSISTGPNLAALVTPNTLFAAVSSLPTATAGGASSVSSTPTPVVTAAVSGVAPSSGPAVVAQ